MKKIIPFAVLMILPIGLQAAPVSSKPVNLLFNLADDPAEMVDQAQANPEVVERLKADLRKFVESMPSGAHQ